MYSIHCVLIGHLNITQLRAEAPYEQSDNQVGTERKRKKP
jgi:hypothetical protein